MTEFNLGKVIGPEGPIGPTGPQGAGFTLRGLYSSTTNYALLDVVESNDGSSYISRQDNNTGHEFGDSDWWQLLAQKGGAAEIFQTLGNSTTGVMSQDAVTRALAEAGGGSGIRSATIVIGFTDDCDIVITGADNHQTFIQQAIDSIPDTGGTVLIREGTYVINSRIMLRKNYLTLMGSGHASTLTGNPPARILSLTETSNSLTIKNLRFVALGSANALGRENSNITVKDLILANNYFEVSSNEDQNITAGYLHGYCLVINNYFANGDIWLFGDSRLSELIMVVSGNIFVSAFPTGTYLAFVGHTKDTQFICSNNLLKNKVQLVISGVYIKSGIVANNNIVSSATTKTAMALSYLNNTIISNNSIIGGSEGILCESKLNNCVISNNIVQGAKNVGMKLDGDNLDILGNQISKSVKLISIFQTSKNVKISNNSLFDARVNADATGISIDASVTNLSITNNKITDVSNGITAYIPSAANRLFKDVRTEGNAISNVTNTGINLTNASASLTDTRNTTVLNNSLSGITSGATGIVVSGMHELVLSNNIVMGDSQTDGVYLKVTQSGPGVISNNTVFGGQLIFQLLNNVETFNNVSISLI